MRPDQGDNPPEQPQPEVAALLQALRQVKESKDLSLDAFTHDTGYSRSSWNRVLKGTAFPPRTAVERLCSRRGLDKNELLGLWDAADQARRAEGAREEAPPAPDPAVPAPARDTGPSEDPAPATKTPAPVPAADALEPAPSTPAPVAPARPATSRSRVRTLALIAAALAALLIVGRWYTTHGTDNPGSVAQPETSGANRPGDDQPPQTGETPLAKSSSTAPTRKLTDDKKKDVDQDPPAVEDVDAKPQHPASTATANDKPSAPASASPGTAASPGAAGRASCRYNWDRTQVMAKGMVGSKVKQIQCLLNSNYDYTLTVDGKFGESTDVAVRAVQSCSGLKPDGQVGPQTWKYLDTPMPGCGH
ncbi:peptidoglycan-binding protein [Streptomyces sp. NPDC092952]|uniref:peptidoglycan-binding protein n=1 Tax=Streptomyces sp. NPDC092952 TaxID=3366018 RepID=UPI0037F87118